LKENYVGAVFAAGAMESALVILGFWLAFAGSHTLLSSSWLRPTLTEKLGQKYLLAYSAVALITFLPMTIYYGNHKHQGPLLWEDGPRPITYTLMALTVFFLASSFISPPPGSLVGGGSLAVRGISKVTRHPAFLAFILFGLAHLNVNGYLSDLAFWGGWVLYTPLGAWHQEQRKLREAPEAYREVLAHTSFIPGLAILQGRQKFSLGELGWVPWVATPIGILLLIQAHPYLAGVSLIKSMNP
jgi:uncharacterized membrane protein